VLEQETASSERTPAGTLCEVQPIPPSLLVKMFGPPTEVQFDPSTQAIEESTGPGVPRSFHWAPPSVVSMTWEPTATHDVSVTQVMPLSALMPTGGVCVVHIPPPLVVLRMATPGPPEDDPTAVQSD